MSHPLILLGELVKTSLNSTSFSQAFTALRLYEEPAEVRTERGLNYFDTLKVWVFPATHDMELASTDSTIDELTIHVGVMKRIANQAAIDALMLLVSEISDHLRFRTLTSGGTSFSWIRTRHEMIYEPEHLTERRQFTSILAPTWRIRRKAS